MISGGKLKCAHNFSLSFINPVHQHHLLLMGFVSRIHTQEDHSLLEEFLRFYERDISLDSSFEFCRNEIEKQNLFNQ
jgi:hypothetical protein